MTGSGPAAGVGIMVVVIGALLVAQLFLSDKIGLAAMGATGILFEAFVHTALKKRAALAKTDAAIPR